MRWKLPSLALAGLLLLALPAAEAPPQTHEMVIFSYVSQDCEIMGRVRVQWIQEWDAEADSLFGSSTATDIGPNRSCGFMIYAPTVARPDGSLAATIITFSRNDPVVDTLYSPEADDE